MDSSVADEVRALEGVSGSGCLGVSLAAVRVVADVGLFLGVDAHVLLEGRLVGEDLATHRATQSWSQRRGTIWQSFCRSRCSSWKLR